MLIRKITPQGYCKGVIYSIHLIKNVLCDPKIPRPIYILGDLVHNTFVTKALIDKGVIVLSGNSRLEMLHSIDSGTVVITAHGTSNEVIKVAQKKGIYVVDATCKDVKKTHAIIENKIQEGYDVLFFGKQNHPETEGILPISDKITLIEETTNLDSLIITNTKKIALATQTTMSFIDVMHLHQSLLTRFPHIELIDEVCNASRLRQEAILGQAKDFDLCIVVGDPKSNNTDKLYMLAKSVAKDAIKIQDVSDLNNVSLDSYTNICISSGASTPTKIVDEIVDALRKYQSECKKNHHYISILHSDDYLL